MSKTGYFSNLVLDYLNNDPKLKPFYTYAPSLPSFREAIEDKSKQEINRDLLVEVLNDQNLSILNSSNALVSSNIQLLLSKDTFSVTTGHQLCLFTGPLYFIYKIITTINLAEELNKAYPNNFFVPIYWMASEDHDFDEINHIHLFGKKIIWDQPARGAVGNLKTSSLNSLLEELKSQIGNSDKANQLLDILNKAYSGNTNLAKATRYLVNEIFGKYGLVIIDGNDSRLKSLFSDEIADDVIKNSNYDCVAEVIDELSQLGFKPQVNPRKINCFYMKEGIRERIVRTDSKDYHVLNTTITFTEKQMLSEIKTYPERFSPNVTLRPLYQEKILPNIAYIGGGGELAYWLEYKKMFEHHNINFPVLVLRNSVLWIDKSSSEKLNKLGIDEATIFSGTDKLLRKFITENASIDLSLKDEEDQLKLLYEGIIKKAEILDKTLAPSVEAELQKHLKALKNIEQKLIRAEKNKQEVSVNQIKKIKEKLFPGDGLQERHDNFIPWFLKYGFSFIELLKVHLQPLEAEMVVIEEN